MISFAVLFTKKKKKTCKTFYRAEENWVIMLWRVTGFFNGNLEVFSCEQGILWESEFSICNVISIPCCVFYI